MSNDYKSTKFKNWLNNLQQESWQLELLISGFAIFGLITVFEPLLIKFQIAENEQAVYHVIIYIIAIISCSILIFNLLLHVFLRGLWIGALGLRYVSGDIEFDELKYHPRFTNYLIKKIGSFDKYIASLENYCSVLFAISFLLIFYILGIFVTVFSLVITITSIEKYDDNAFVSFFLIVFAVFLGLGIFLTLIDFLTQGFLKKKKWLAKIYFPFYWVFSFLTLSFMYRPLVYNFLDHKFGKRLSYILIPFYIGIGVLISFKNTKSNYLEAPFLSSKNYIDHRNYEDSLIKEDEFIRVASIQSKVVKDSYIRLFRVFSDNVEDRIFSYHPSLKPMEDLRGFSSDVVVIHGNDNLRMNSRKRDSIVNVYLNVFNETHEVFIDDLQYKSDFIITKNKKNQLGFETYLNIKKLEEGKHHLKLNRFRKSKKDTLLKTEVIIPFWHFKN